MERGRLPARNSNPFERGPVTGPNTPLGKGASEITCLSCQPHHSQYANLMRPDVRNQMAVCETCHKVLLRLHLEGKVDGVRSRYCSIERSRHGRGGEQCPCDIIPVFNQGRGGKYKHVHGEGFGRKGRESIE